MKAIFLGDIHGRSIWQSIVANEKDADIFLFLGDYFDSKESISGPKQLENFRQIIAFKQAAESQGKQVVLLFGNHDFHYMPWHTREPYSGYQKTMAPKIQKALLEHFEQFQMAYSFDDVLCSHAGISSIWLHRNIGPEGEVGKWMRGDLQSIVAAVNRLFLEKPKAFDSQGFDSSGDEPQQTPIWIRPYSLVKANVDIMEPHCRQVFGHTRMKDLDKNWLEVMELWNGRYIATDGLHLGAYWIYDSGEFQRKLI